jgi:thioredoxin-related protein
MKRMRIWMVIMMAFLALPSFALAADGVTWLTLKAGLEKAKLEKKPVLVDYYFGKGCPRCEKLDKEEYNNPAIAQKIMSDFIPVRVDLTKKLTEDEEKLGEKYQYKKDCMLLFLDSEGNIINDSKGKGLSCATMIDSEMFSQYLDMVKKSLSEKR